jgi:4-aminobutyrate aminotransferase-like enzyme
LPGTTQSVVWIPWNSDSKCRVRLLRQEKVSWARPQPTSRVDIQWISRRPLLGRRPNRNTRPGAATFGGNLVSCRAALATLEFHKRHQLGERSTALGERLRGQLVELQRRRPEIAEVRGRGLMIGVELRDGASCSAAALTDTVLERMKDAGFLLGKTGSSRNVLTLMPPLVVSSEALDSIVDGLDGALRAE